MRPHLALAMSLASMTAAAETLEGVVTNAATQKPLSGANVVIVGGPSTTTAGDGSFRLSGLRPGTYTLVLRGPGGGSVEQRVEVIADATLRVTVSLGDSPEVVRIKERVGPPKRRPPEPVERYSRLTPPYSDPLIDANDWAVVWLLLHVDERGNVTRVDVLKSPPQYKLDDLVVKHVQKFKFKPGLNDDGKPAPYEIVYKLEYVPYWSIFFGGPRDPPCAGSGPLNLDSSMPVYRDCEPPSGYDVSRMR